MLNNSEDDSDVIAAARLSGQRAVLWFGTDMLLTI